jgi:hypothetical protein
MRRTLVEYSIPVIRILPKHDKNKKIIFIEEGMLIWNNLLFEKGASFRLFENEIKILTPFLVFECTPLKIEKEILIYSDYESHGESFYTLKEDNFALEGLKLLDIDIDQLIEGAENNQGDSMTEIKFISIHFPELNEDCKGRLIAYEEFYNERYFIESSLWKHFPVTENPFNQILQTFFSEYDDFAIELIDKTNPYAFVNIEISSSVETTSNPQGIYFDTFRELYTKEKKVIYTEAFVEKYCSTLDSLIENLRI